MTHPEARRAVRSYALPTVLAVFAVGIAVNFALLIPTLQRQARQAREGQKARDTQCRVFPIALELYTAAEHYHLITAADLETYKAAAPRGCPHQNP